MPYSNYRGIDRGGRGLGKMWIPLDPSFKQYNFTEGINLQQSTGIDPQARKTENGNGRKLGKLGTVHENMTILLEHIRRKLRRWEVRKLGRDEDGKVRKWESEKMRK